MSLIDNCNRCKVKLSDEEKLQAEKSKFIPLCYKCLPVVKLAYEKCQPLLKKLNL